MTESLISLSPQPQRSTVAESKKETRIVLRDIGFMIEGDPFQSACPGLLRFGWCAFEDVSAKIEMLFLIEPVGERTGQVKKGSMAVNFRRKDHH